MLCILHHFSIFLQCMHEPNAIMEIPYNKSINPATYKATKRYNKNQIFFWKKNILKIIVDNVAGILDKAKVFCQKSLSILYSHLCTDLDTRIIIFWYHGYWPVPIYTVNMTEWCPWLTASLCHANLSNKELLQDIGNRTTAASLNLGVR